MNENETQPTEPLPPSTPPAEEPAQAVWPARIAARPHGAGRVVAALAIAGFAVLFAFCAGWAAHGLVTRIEMRHAGMMRGGYSQGLTFGRQGRGGCRFGRSGGGRFGTQSPGGGFGQQGRGGVMGRGWRGGADGFGAPGSSQQVPGRRGWSYPPSLESTLTPY